MMNPVPTLPVPALTATETLQRLAVRRLMRQRRIDLTDAQQVQAAVDLCRRALAYPALQNAHHIALYSPFDGEIDTQPLCRQLWQQDKQLYLPHLDPEQPGKLLFFPYTKDTKLRRNRLGILEPGQPLENPCPLSQLAVILLPLVAFDAKCHRIGMGGGYYDRTLNAYLPIVPPQPSLVMIGIAHECQQVASLPQAPWDRRLHAVITPRQLFGTHCPAEC